MMYITAVSGVMVLAGTLIRNYDDDAYDDDLPDFVKVLFAGGFMTTFFWVCHRLS